MQALLQRVFDGFESDAVLVSGSRFLIGTDEACQLHPSSPFIGSQHCEIEIVHGRTIVRDLDSGRGTYVNGRRLSGFCELQTGDILIVGMAVYKVLLLDDSSTRRMNFSHYARISVLDQGSWDCGIPAPTFV